MALTLQQTKEPIKDTQCDMEAWKHHLVKIKGILLSIYRIIMYLPGLALCQREALR